MRPIKSIVPVSISRMRKMKGRSTVTSIGLPGTAVSLLVTAVAAAGSIPALLLVE